MFKSKTIRVAGLLLALTLVTSCFVGGTFAKYTTAAKGEDTARVAKFGVTLATSGEVFGEDYAITGDAEGADMIANSGTYTVSSSEEGKNVVAPGTKGVLNLITISGTPEVAIEVTATLNFKGENVTEDTLKMIKLPKNENNTTYTDYTVVTGYENNASTYGTFTTDTDYYPIKWTLKKDGTAVTNCENVNLQAIQDYLTDTISGKYYFNEVPTGVTGGKLMSVFTSQLGAYTLEWKWDFEGTGENAALIDKMDTYLGNAMANVFTKPDGVSLEEAFSFSIVITQID